MPIKSYLVFPHAGEKSKLTEKLSELKWCEVMPAENKELLVLVTDTTDEADEENCLKKINALTELEHYTLVSGFE
ncbi:MAG: hypothetical protein ABJF11_15145 [Reichenbachiella sp.]|uniref:hypothetical protein n=1 Tax=Reichenbachiella sp. TaxID=2184521 RepID=UPI003264E06D